MDSPARVGRLRNRRAAWLGFIAKLLALLWIGGALLTTMYMFHEPPWVPAVGILSGIAGFVAALMMIGSWVTSMRLGMTPGHVSVHDGVLHLKQARYPMPIPLRDVRSAHAERGVVRIETRAGDTWLVELDDDAMLVDELGFAPGQRPVVYRFGNRYRRFLHLAVGFFAYYVAIVVETLVIVNWNDVPRTAMMLAVMAACYAVGKRLVRAPVITVGTDGVWIETLGFRRRFVPIGDIVMAHQMVLGGPVRLKLRSGEILHVAGVWIDPARRDAAANHIRALLGKRAAQPPIALAREGRSVREWREHLRRVVEGAGYRVAASNGSLADLVSAPGLSREERVGAALALRVSGEAARIRVAAEQCVDPKTRAALEAAAEAEVDEAAIERALNA